MSKSATFMLNFCRKESSSRVVGETLAAALSVDGRECSNPSFQHAAARITNPPISSDPTTQLYLMNALAQ